MNNLDFTSLEIREYLLGTAESETLREKIEERLMIDENFFDAVQCEEEELIEDYVFEELSKQEKNAFEENFVLTDERKNKLRFARIARQQIAVYKIEKDEENKNKDSIITNLINFFRGNKTPVFASAFTILILFLGGMWFLSIRTDDADLVKNSLNKAYKIQRPLESRISELEYAPTKDATRGNETEKIDKIELDNAQLTANKAVRENENAKNLHALIRVYLAEKRFDDAILQLEKAINLEPENAKLHNDLGVALMEKGKQSKDRNYLLFPQALREIEKAILLDKSLLDAYFNKALCLSLLGSPTEEKEAWQNYLKMDADSQWAKEARKRLENIEINKPISKNKDEILRDFLTAYNQNDRETAWKIHSKNREIITGKLVPQQLTFLFVQAKTQNDDAKSEEYLKALIYLGNLEAEKTGDLFWKNIAEFYLNLKESETVFLAQAHNFVKSGISGVGSDEQKALSDLKNAQNLLKRIGNDSEVLLVDFVASYCENRLGNLEESERILQELSSLSEKKNYKWINSQGLSWRANNAVSLYKISDAIRFNKEANLLAEQTEDVLGQQKTLIQLAENYASVGQFEKSAELIEKNLQFGKLPEASLRQKWRDFSAIGKILYKMELFHASLAFQKEAMFVAQNLLEEKTFSYTTFIDLGLVNSKIGNFEEALNFIEKGKQAAEQLNDEETKRKSFAYTNLNLAHIKRSADKFSEAVEHYRESINYYENREFQLGLYDSYKGLLMCFRAEKRDAEFERELPKIIQIFENYRAKIFEEQNRNSFFNNEQNIYDVAVAYEFDRNNFEQAFDYMEKSRSRSLLDLMKKNKKISEAETEVPTIVTEPLKLNEIRAQMPAEVQIVQYAVLQDKVAIWLVSKTGVITAQTEINASELEEITSEYLKQITKKDAPNVEKENELAVKLYQILIGPIEEKLDSQKEICLIADKSLLQIPFNTLISPKTNRRFISDYVSFFAPSANTFLLSSKKASERESEIDEELLSIGNPAFNQEIFADLPTLVSARKEAEKIAEFYEKKTVLVEQNALKQIVKENLSQANVVHFAGHYLVNPKSAMLSGLVLANETDGILANQEIIGEKLSRTKLIVLSACQTGAEGFYKGEGMIGASRTFLSTGVPLVVATQWAVESEATAELMIKFQHYRKIKKLSTINALRQAQLDLLSAQNKQFQQPYYWAAFITLGGYAKF